MHRQVPVKVRFAAYLAAVDVPDDFVRSALRCVNVIVLARIPSRIEMGFAKFRSIVGSLPDLFSVLDKDRVQVAIDAIDGKMFFAVEVVLALLQFDDIDFRIRNGLTITGCKPILLTDAVQPKRRASTGIPRTTFDAGFKIAIRDRLLVASHP